MSVIGLVVILAFIAWVLWLVNVKGTAMNPTIKLLINVALIAVAVIFVLAAFGLWDEIRSVKVPHI